MRGALVPWIAGAGCFDLWDCGYGGLWSLELEVRGALSQGQVRYGFFVHQDCRFVRNSLIPGIPGAGCCGSRKCGCGVL